MKFYQQIDNQIIVNIFAKNISNQLKKMNHNELKWVFCEFEHHKLT